MTSSIEPSSGAGPSLWRHRDFRRYLSGQAASVTGSAISSVVIPVLAVVEWDATSAEVAWLTFLGQLPPALPALHAGALANRHSKRKQMITGDLVSADAPAGVPVAAAQLDAHASRRFAQRGPAADEDRRRPLP
ncbi:hypothetical protein [Streptomyces lavendulae]|uniref:hypothetical protein n=1 Tax=Streptomyces lavendulae TaxID=1914 RepID=UPI0033FDCBED